MFGFGGATETVRLGIEGMSCGHCVKRVEDALASVKGVKKVAVSLEGKNAEVTFLPSRVSTDALIKAVADVGFAAKVLA